MIPLTTNLEYAGCETIGLGDRIVVVPHGARVLGLFARPGLNALWTNPALASRSGTESLLNESGWVNLGGHRTWMSLEIDTHVKDPADPMPTYTVPHAVDPGNYHVEACSNRSVTLRGEAEVFFRRVGCTVPLTIERTIDLLDAPPVPLPGTIDFAGYRLGGRLSCPPVTGCDARPGLWSIVQVPGGGRIVLPVARNASPRAFMGTPAFRREDNRLVVEVSTDENFKFAIHASQSRGLMLYRGATPEARVLLACNFRVLDPSVYADVPCDDPTALGYMQQVYIDDGQLGGFGELEHHSAALDASSGGAVEDHCEVWAFAGDDLDELEQTLLARLARPLPGSRPTD